MSGVNDKPCTNDNTQDSLAKDNINNYTGDGEGGSEPHEDNALHTSILARGRDVNNYGDSGSGIGSDVPVSVGRIHDVFPGLEKDFGLLKSKRKAACSTLSVCPDSETTADSIPRFLSQREPQVAVEDGVADNWQAAEAAEGDAARLSQSQIETTLLIDCALTVIFFNDDIKNNKHPAAFRDLFTPADLDIADEVLENLSTNDIVASIDRLVTTQTDTSELIKTASAVNQLRQSQGIQDLIPATTLHSLNQKITSFQQTLLSSSPKTAEDASGSDPGTAAQGGQARKRSRSLTNSTAYLDNDILPKRPRRATKETWKVREARMAKEAREANRSQAPSHSFRVKQAHSIRPGHKLWQSVQQSGRH